MLLIAAYTKIILAQDGEKEVCATTEFHCYESSIQPCIPRKWMCDDKPDCQKGEDERHCQHKVSSCSAEIFSVRILENVSHGTGSVMVTWTVRMAVMKDPCIANNECVWMMNLNALTLVTV